MRYTRTPDRLASDSGNRSIAPPEPVDAATLRAWIEQLQSSAGDLSDPARIDLLRSLEELTCAAAAAQAGVTADFDESQRAEQASRGVPAARQGRGVAAQIALARQESPHRGQQHLGLATVLRDELPHTMAGFAAGRITEWKATLVERVVSGEGCGARPGVMINLVVSDTTLWGGSDEAAHVDGYGPIPADLARELAASDRAWLRRIYTNPATGSLVAMDSTARLVPSGLARLLRLRDRTCRTPWCDAPIRHSDHASPGPRTAKPARSTPRASARPATTPSRPPAGRPDRDPDRGTSSRRPPRPGTAITRPLPRWYDRRTSRNNLASGCWSPSQVS